MTDENRTQDESFDMDGNTITHGTANESGIIDVPKDRDGKLIMTASIEGLNRSAPITCAVGPTEEEIEIQKKNDIAMGAFQATKAEKGGIEMTSSDLVQTTEGQVTAKTNYGVSIPLHKANPHDYVCIPGVFDSIEAELAENMGYIIRNPNTGLYQEG